MFQKHILFVSQLQTGVFISVKWLNCNRTYFWKSYQPLPPCCAYQSLTEISNPTQSNVWYLQGIKETAVLHDYNRHNLPLFQVCSCLPISQSFCPPVLQSSSWHPVFLSSWRRSGLRHSSSALPNSRCLSLTLSMNDFTTADVRECPDTSGKIPPHSTLHTLHRAPTDLEKALCLAKTKIK